MDGLILQNGYCVPSCSDGYYSHSGVCLGEVNSFVLYSTVTDHTGMVCVSMYLCLFVCGIVSFATLPL